MTKKDPVRMQTELEDNGPESFVFCYITAWMIPSDRIYTLLELSIFRRKMPYLSAVNYFTWIHSPQGQSHDYDYAVLP